MLPPVTLISSLIGPTIAQVITTMGKTRLHAKCRFYSAMVIKGIPVAFVLYQIAVVGSGLVQDSKLGHWSSSVSLDTPGYLIIGLGKSVGNYSRSSPDILTTHNLCS